MDQLYTFIWLIVTLLFIGFFAGYEIAFLSANRLSIELKKKQGRNGGIIVGKFLEKPTQFLGTCLIGINIFLVAYGLLFDALLNSSIWNFFKRFFDIENRYLKLIFNTLLSTLVVLIFGEFIPKAIFRARNDGLLIVFAPLAKFFHNLFQPLAVFFVGISQWILKYIFNVPVKDKSEVFSKVDLEHLYQQNKDTDEDNAEVNNELFENALSLPMVKIRQCLVPRTEIEAVEISATLEEVRERYIQTKLSKLIVYEDTIDNILGYIHQLDLFKKPAAIKDILLPIPAVPETMSATDLINKFTKERKTIAWVVDEFGGTAGIVTLEDLLEEIFGEIKDEYDTEDLVEKQIAEREFLFSGRLELDYLNEKYNLSFNDEEAETLSGFIINQHGTIPKPKEKIIIGSYQFDVLNVSETRIDMVKLKILE
jgi:CBS domain containing-hemolysin-like protein